MGNVFILNSSQQSRLQSYGFTLESDLVSAATSTLIESLRSEICDISDIYSVDQLLMLFEAVHGDDRIIPIEKRQKRFKKDIKVESRQFDGDAKRRKIRIDLTADMSYAMPLLEHLAKYEKLEVVPIKTGMAIKHKLNGFKSNIANFNELRTIKGVLHGNLYLNQIRCEEKYDSLNIPFEYKWFRGFVLLPKVDIYKVVDILNDENLSLLKEFSRVSNKRRKFNTKKMLQKI